MSDSNQNIKLGSAEPLDELVLHRYLEGRLDSKERSTVDELLRVNATARRTLDALREEQTLIREAFEPRVEPAHRIADKVLFTLYSEERKRQQVIRNRKWRRQISIGFGLAAAVALCFFLIRPRDAAGLSESGTVASLITRSGERRALTHDSRIYEGDAIIATQGQFVRLHLTSDALLDVDEFSRVVVDKGGNAPEFHMQSGRLGVNARGSRHTTVIYLPQGSVTIPAGAWVEVWLPQESKITWPDLLATLPPQAHSTSAEKPPVPAIVTVFRGSVSFANEKTPTGTTLNAGDRALFSAQAAVTQKLDLANTHAQTARDDQNCWNTQDTGPQDRPIVGLLQTPDFMDLGKRLKMDVKVPDALPEALKGLQTALDTNSPTERVVKLASAQAELRRASEMLSVDDARRPYGRMLEGLAHAARGQVLLALDQNGERNAAATSAFEAATVAFEEALRTSADDNTQKPSTWAQSMNTPGSVLSNLTAADQSALLAAFNHAVALYWQARTGDARRAGEAADEFEALHTQLGRHIEALAARYGQAAAYGLAGQREKAIAAYDDILSTSLAGCSDPIRKLGEGLKQAALMGLAHEYVGAGQVDKAKLVEQDFKVLFPLDENSPVLGQIQREIDRAATK